MTNLELARKALNFLDEHECPYYPSCGSGCDGWVYEGSDCFVTFTKAMFINRLSKLMDNPALFEGFKQAPFRYDVNEVEGICEELCLDGVSASMWEYIPDELRDLYEALCEDSEDPELIEQFNAIGDGIYTFQYEIDGGYAVEGESEIELTGAQARGLIAQEIALDIPCNWDDPGECVDYVSSILDEECKEEIDCGSDVEDRLEEYFDLWKEFIEEILRGEVEEEDLEWRIEDLPSCM